jgi:small-conductance mechanosensitive channel/CRP-like cAMP-binding protein
MADWRALTDTVLVYRGSLVTLGLLALAGLVHRLAPAEESRRGGVAVGMLAAALALRLAGSVAGASAVHGVLDLAADVALAVGVVDLVWTLALDLALARTRLRVPSILRDLAQGAAVFFVLLAVLRRAGVDVFSLVTTSAVVTAVVGLALQATIANVFAGLALQLDRTLQAGDWIRLDDRVGQIVEIRWRSTSVLTRDGDVVIVPNGELVNSKVLNFSRPRPAHRVTLTVGFHYRHPPNAVKRVLVESVRGTPGVREDLPHDCVVREFGESAVTYALRFWIDDLRREDEIADAVRTRVWYAARREHLEIPFPIRTLLTPAADDRATRAERQRARRAAALDGVELFSPLGPEDRARLAEAMRRVRFAAGEVVIRQGDPGGSLYLLERGRVGVSLTVDGITREVATLGPGDVLGEMSLLTGAPREATCVAKSDVTAYVVDHSTMRALVAGHPRLAEDMAAILARRQSENEGERRGLSREARALAAAAAARTLGQRVRSFFGLA